MAAKIKKVGVLGAGLMGHGITQVAAQAGYDVVVFDGAPPKTVGPGNTLFIHAASPEAPPT